MNSAKGRAKDSPLGTMICISILLHGVLFFVLSKNKERPTTTKPFRMEWHTIAGSAKTIVKSPAKNKFDSSKKNQPLQNQSSRGAKSLQAVLRTDWSGLTKQHAENQALSQELGDVEIAANGIQLNLEKALRDDRELPLLWKQIRVFLRYRPEHALARIAGDVHLRIRVDRFGKLLRIFHESATGREELLGWTILCLLEAFREPFLSHPLESPRTLDLRVQYTVRSQVLPSQAKSARMIFVVEGDRYTGSDAEERNPAPKGHLVPENAVMRNPFEISIFSMSTKQIADTFRDKTLKNHKEWSYFSQREYYREQCHRHLNQQACKKLQELTQVVEP
jgi:hypothetical protein